MKKLEILEPASLEEACDRLSEAGEGVKVVGGGVALAILMKQKIFRPERLIAVRRIPQFDDIRHEPDQGLVIGAGALHRTLETSPVVREHCPLLGEVMSQVANVRIRCYGDARRRAGPRRPPLRPAPRSHRPRRQGPGPGAFAGSATSPSMDSSPAISNRPWSRRDPDARRHPAFGPGHPIRLSQVHPQQLHGLALPGRVRVSGPLQRRIL